MKIRQATLKDIVEIARLEKRTQKGEATSLEQLLARFRMFPQGFYLASEIIPGRASDYEQIVGYTSSCLWNKGVFRTYEEVKDFPKHHTPTGQTLYIITLAFDKHHQNQEVGSELGEKLQDVAQARKKEIVQVVSDKDMVGFYEKLGFDVIEELPRFWNYKDGILMEYDVPI